MACWKMIDYTQAMRLRPVVLFALLMAPLCCFGCATGCFGEPRLDRAMQRDVFVRVRSQPRCEPGTHAQRMVPCHAGKGCLPCVKDK